MRLVLEIQTGLRVGRTFEIHPGQIAQVGRSGWADLAIPEDPALADIHFLLECGQTECRIRNLNPAGGTMLNGSKVTLAVIHDGDQIVAGQSSFTLRLVGDGRSLSPVEASSVGQQAGLSPFPGEQLGPPTGGVLICTSIRPYTVNVWHGIWGGDGARLDRFGRES